MKKNKDLEEKIRTKREELNNLLANGTIPDEALSVSVELDELLNKYMELQFKDDTL